MSRGKVTTELAGVGATEESIVGAFAVEHEIAADADVVGEEAAAAIRGAGSRARRARSRVDGCSPPRRSG